MPFVKLYTKVLDSSIWVNEDATTRLLWITMLAMSDSDGYVRAPLVGIAARARISLADAERGMERLTSPDAHSSSSDHEGRRVESNGPGCWLVLNRRKYWDLRTKEQADNAARQASFQAKRRAAKASGAVSSNATNGDNARSRTEGELDREREGDQEPPTVVEGFALRPPVPPPKVKPTKAKRPPPGSALEQCDDQEWAAVLHGYARAREIGGMPAQWGAYRDTPTNRNQALRIFREGYSAADLLAVLEHIGRGLAAGTHDPKWTTLEHVARTMGRYTQEAAAAAPRGKPSPKPTAPLEIDGVTLTDEELAVYRSNAVPAHGAWAVQVLRQRQEAPTEPDPEILRSLGLGGAR